MKTKQDYILIGLISLAITEVILLGIWLMLAIGYNKDSLIQECKVLETYQTSAAYKVSEKFIVIVNVIEYDRVASLELSPALYYKANLAHKHKNNIYYWFSQREIDKLNSLPRPWYIRGEILMVLIMVLCVTVIMILFNPQLNK